MTEFRCKHCGSLNLELEEKGNQTGLYCCDCGKWLKWITKEEKRVFNNKNTCTPIYASKGATNGDMMIAMFPNLKVEIEGNTITCWIDEYRWFAPDYDWWIASYKIESEE